MIAGALAPRAGRETLLRQIGQVPHGLLGVVDEGAHGSGEVAAVRIDGVPGVYRNMTGNEALVLGMVTAGQKSGLNIFLASYPITPATEVLQFTSLHKNFGIRTLQAEDEISAIGIALGASFAGDIGMTVTISVGIRSPTRLWRTGGACPLVVA